MELSTISVRRGFSAAILLSALWSGNVVEAGSGEVIVELFNSSFFPQTVNVTVGGTVTWVRVAGSHRIISGTGPEDPHAGDLFDAIVDAASPRFSFEITHAFPDGISFFDEVVTGREGFISVDNGEISHRVGVVDNVFIPDALWIFAGDTVRWEHEPMEMFHTVTSGTGADDPRSGELFDVPSSDDDPVFEYQFAESGVQPYYCIPHERLGMVGTIFVQKLFVRGDTSGDDVVDISDPVATLNFLFLGGEKGNCDDALDANDDGKIDIGDAVFALNYLFLGSDEIPAPFPRAGQDRSDDGLDCLSSDA